MVNRKIVVFGAGSSGEKVLERLHKDVVCVADNDPLKHGKDLYGKPVVGPDELSRLDFDTIVIASVFENDIKNQLIRLGFKDKIALFRRSNISAFREDIEEIKFISENKIDLPQLRTMHLNLTSACNIQCRTCRPEGFHYKATFLDRATIESIVEDAFDDLTHLRLDSSGELTLSPHLEFVLKEASKRKISVFISTNGTRIDKEFAEMIVSSTVETMQVSLDSPDKDTNEWIRKGAKHESILQGVTNLVKARKKLGRNFPEIHFHGAILQQNIHQLKDMVQLAKDIGIEGTTFAYGYIHSYMDPNWSIYFDRKLCNEKLAAAKAHAQKLGLFFNSPPSFYQAQKTISKEKYCQYLFQWTYVDPSGKIFPCCTGAGEYVVGNAKTEKISDIWVNENYQKLRETYNTDNPEWDKCSRCYMLTGWDVDDYKVHFDPNHWSAVKNQLSDPNQPHLICRSG